MSDFSLSRFRERIAEGQSCVFSRDEATALVDAVELLRIQVDFWRQTWISDVCPSAESLEYVDSQSVHSWKCPVCSTNNAYEPDRCHECGAGVSDTYKVGRWWEERNRSIDGMALIDEAIKAYGKDDDPGRKV